MATDSLVPGSYQFDQPLMSPTESQMRLDYAKQLMGEKQKPYNWLQVLSNIGGDIRARQIIGQIGQQERGVAAQKQQAAKIPALAEPQTAAPTPEPTTEADTSESEDSAAPTQVASLGDVTAKAAPETEGKGAAQAGVAAPGLIAGKPQDIAQVLAQRAPTGRQPAGRAMPPSPQYGVPPGQKPQTYVDPRIIVPRHQITDKQMQNIILFSDPQERAQYMQWYMQQNEPIAIQPYGENGPTIMAHPRDPSKQWKIPGKLVPSTLKGAGGMEIPGYVQQDLDENGRLVIRQFPIQGPAEAGPPSGIPNPQRPATAAPPQPRGPTTPQPSPQQAPDVPDLIPEKRGEAAPAAEQPPTMLGVAPPAEGAKPKNVQVASLGPTGATATDVPPPEVGRLAQAETEQPPLPRKGEGETKVAQVVSPYQQQQLDYLKQQGAEFEGMKKYTEKDAESYDKNLNQFDDLARRSMRSAPLLENALSLVKDPATIQGAAADIRLALAKISRYAGFDPKAAGQTLAFQKLIAGEVLDEMRIQLEKMGQIRNVEIDLVKRSTASIYNTPEANEAVLDIALRTHKLTAELGRIADAYNQGVRWDAKGRVIRDAQGNPVLTTTRPTNSGLQATINTYVRNNPMFTPQEIADYNHRFDVDQAGGTAKAKGKGFFPPKQQGTDRQHGPALGTEPPAGFTRDVPRGGR